MAGNIRVVRWVFFLVFGCGVALASGANAAGISCLPVAAQLNTIELGAFSGHPEGLLLTNPGGGLPLSGKVREIAGSSSDTLDAIMGLVGKASEAQRSAIAAGLARVVSTCKELKTESATGYGDLISAAIASTSDEEFMAAFQSATKDIEVASVNAASSAFGGGSTGDGGGDDGGSGNAYRSPGDEPLDTTTGSYQSEGSNSYSFDNSNSFGDDSTATSNSALGQ